MNVWLWNSDFVFVVALVNCFSYDLKFWILRPSISRWFSPIRHLAKTDSAFRTVFQKEFGSRPCFSFRHVSRTFVISHRQRAPSCFCTVTAAHSPLFCWDSYSPRVTTKRSAQLIALEFVSVFLFLTCAYGPYSMSTENPLYTLSRLKR